MKRFLHSSLIVVAAILSTASMCEDDNNVDPNNKDVETSLGQGTWKVAYFFDKQDETSDFAGYTFQFNDEGVAIATRSALSVQGSWDTEDTSHGHTKLYLEFGTSDPLEELSEDWIIMEFSALRVTLEHESGGDGDIDSLVLERN